MIETHLLHTEGVLLGTTRLETPFSLTAANKSPRKLSLKTEVGYRAFDKPYPKLTILIRCRSFSRPQPANSSLPPEAFQEQHVQPPLIGASNPDQPPIQPRPSIQERDKVKKGKMPRAQPGVVMQETENYTGLAGPIVSQADAPHPPADRIHDDVMNDMVNAQPKMQAQVEDDALLNIAFDTIVPETQAGPITPFPASGDKMSSNYTGIQMQHSNESGPNLNGANVAFVPKDDQYSYQQCDEVETTQAMQKKTPPTVATPTDVEANPEPEDETVTAQLVTADTSSHEHIQRMASPKMLKKHRHSSDRRTTIGPSEQFHQVSHTHRPAKVTKPRSSTENAAPTVQQAWNLFRWAQQHDQKERAALEGELNNLRDVHSELQSKLESEKQRSAELESKVHEKQSKINECKQKFEKLRDFMRGLGHDLDKLRENAQARDAEHRDTLEEFKKYAQERENVQLSLAVVGPHIRGFKRTKEDREAFQLAVKDLETKQDELRKQIDGKTLLLNQEKERRTGLENELDHRESTIKELRDQLQSFRTSHNAELANINLVLTNQGQVSKESFQSLVKLATQAQNRPIATPEDMEKLKTQVDDFKTRSNNLSLSF